MSTSPEVELNVPGRDLLVVSSQELVDELRDESRFDKTPSSALLAVRDFVGDGLFTAETHEPDWGAHRLRPSILHELMLARAPRPRRRVRPAGRNGRRRAAVAAASDGARRRGLCRRRVDLAVFFLWRRASDGSRRVRHLHAHLHRSDRSSTPDQADAWLTEMPCEHRRYVTDGCA